MSLVESIIKNEKPRNEYMRKHYENAIAELPKGSVVKKKIGNNEYFYLKYRDGKKTMTDYIGKYSEDIEKLCEDIYRRKHYEELLVDLNKEYKLIKKVLGATT